MAKRESKPISNEKSAAGGLKRWRKRLLGLAVGVIALALLLLWLLFSAHPRYPVPALSGADQAFQTKMMVQEMPKIYRSEPDDVSEFELTPAEVRSLLRCVANGVNIAELFRASISGRVRNGSSNDYLVNYRDDGVFEIDAVHDTGMPLLFGGHIRLFITGRPNLKDDELSFSVASSQIGALPFHSSLADRVIMGLIEKNYDNRDVQKVRRIVQQLTVDPESGNLTVVYRPYEVRQLF